jgi:hypothetical protein
VAIQDREALSQFLWHLHSFVARGLQRHQGELPEAFALQLRRSWSELESLIGQAGELLFNPDLDVDPGLDAVGLTGDALQLKLSIYYSAARAYEDASSDEAYDEMSTMEVFSDVLEAADITLGSLVAILPLLHPVEELKKVAEYVFAPGRGWFRTWIRRLF